MLPEKTDSWQDSVLSFYPSKTTQLNEKQRRPFVSSVVSFPCKACFSAPLINQDTFHICLILSSPTIPLLFYIFAAVMTSTCPLLMLIAPYFGLCACGTGGGQKFPLGLCRPVQEFLSFFRMWAKDYRKVNKKKHSTFSFFFLGVLHYGIFSFSSFLSEERLAATDLQCFLSHTVGLHQCPLDRRVDRRVTAVTFTNVLFWAAEGRLHDMELWKN